MRPRLQGGCLLYTGEPSFPCTLPQFKSKRFFVKHKDLRTFGLARFLRNRHPAPPLSVGLGRGLLTSPPDCFASRPRLSVQVQAFLRQTQRSANFRTCTISSKSPPCTSPFGRLGSWPTHQPTGLLRFTATPIGSSPHLTNPTHEKSRSDERLLLAFGCGDRTGTSLLTQHIYFIPCALGSIGALPPLGAPSTSFAEAPAALLAVTPKPFSRSFD